MHPSHQPHVACECHADKRTPCRWDLAHAYPRAPRRRVQAPKHELLHRLKRLWHFLDNERLDPLAIQRALLPATIAQLGDPHWLGLALDWTMFDSSMPNGRRARSHVLRMAIPRRGRASPVLQLTYDGTTCRVPTVTTTAENRRWVW